MMPHEQWLDLGNIVSTLAADSILVQQRLDATARDLREQFAELLATTPEATRSLLLPLAPAGIRVTDYQVSCSLRMTTRRSGSFSLVAAPINAGYRTLYGSTTEEESSLLVEVRAAPSLILPPHHH